MFKQETSSQFKDAQGSAWRDRICRGLASMFRPKSAFSYVSFVAKLIFLLLCIHGYKFVNFVKICLLLTTGVHQVKY